jgi:hypothetical protein
VIATLSELINSCRFFPGLTFEFKSRIHQQKLKPNFIHAAHLAIITGNPYCFLMFIRKTTD